MHPWAPDGTVTPDEVGASSRVRGRRPAARRRRRLARVVRRPGRGRLGLRRRRRAGRLRPRRRPLGARGRRTAPGRLPRVAAGQRRPRRRPRAAHGRASPAPGARGRRRAGHAARATTVGTAADRVVLPPSAGPPTRCRTRPGRRMRPTARSRRPCLPERARAGSSASSGTPRTPSRATRCSCVSSRPWSRPPRAFRSCSTRLTSVRSDRASWSFASSSRSVVTQASTALNSGKSSAIRPLALRGQGEQDPAAVARVDGAVDQALGDQASSARP